MTIPTLPNRVQILKHKFTQSLGLPFQDLLPESTIQAALEAEKISYRQRLFDPFVTLWAFLSQVLDIDKSCANAVSRVIAWLARENTPIPSDDASAYCQARKRLPEKLLQRLFGTVAQDLEKKTTTEYLKEGWPCFSVNLPGATWLFYAVLVDLGDAIAEELVHNGVNKPTIIVGQ